MRMRAFSNWLLYLILEFNINYDFQKNQVGGKIANCPQVSQVCDVAKAGSSTTSITTTSKKRKTQGTIIYKLQS